MGATRRGRPITIWKWQYDGQHCRFRSLRCASSAETGTEHRGYLTIHPAPTRCNDEYTTNATLASKISGMERGKEAEIVRG